MFRAFLCAALVLFIAPSYSHAKPRDVVKYWPTYKDEALGFEIKYPKDFYHETLCGGGEGDCRDVYRLMLRDKKFDPEFTLDVIVERRRLSETKDLEKYVNERYDNGKYAKSIKKQTISGRPAFRVVSDGLVTYINLNDSEVLVITWQSRANDWYSADYQEKMVSTVKIVPQENPGKEEVAKESVADPQPIAANDNIAYVVSKDPWLTYDFVPGGLQFQYPSNLIVNATCRSNPCVEENLELKSEGKERGINLSFSVFNFPVKTHDIEVWAKEDSKQNKMEYTGKKSRIDGRSVIVKDSNGVFEINAIVHKNRILQISFNSDPQYTEVYSKIIKSIKFNK
jgi:hypothetical protein